MISASKINDRLDSIFEKNKLSIIYNKKSKRNNILIKDGIITYTVLVKEFECQCTNFNEICDHILFVLYSYFMLEPFIISFILMKDIRMKFVKYVELGVNIRSLNGKLESDIINSLRKIECGICLSSLADKKYKYELYECPICRNCIHYKCMSIWQNQKNSDGSKNGCIYCMAKT